VKHGVVLRVPLESDANGAFNFAQVRPAVYQVRVTHDGFRTYQRDSVTVLVASPTTIEVQLAVGDVKEVITVEAAATPNIQYY